jgi:Cdc6-like AAA superfamily ATPase
MKKLLFGQIYKTDKYNLIVACGENKKPINLLFTETDINKAKERAEKNIEDLSNVEIKHIECEVLEEQVKNKSNHISILTNEIANMHNRLKKSSDHCCQLQNELKELSQRISNAKYCSLICLVLGIIGTICSYFVFFI